VRSHACSRSRCAPCTQYPATEGPWDQPLITGFGLGSSEHKHPGKPYGALFAKAIAAGLTVQPHAGEEWGGGESCFNILDAIEHGAKRIGHGIHALATPSTGLPDQVSVRLVALGVASLAELMKRENVVAEVRKRPCGPCTPPSRDCPSTCAFHEHPPLCSL
jgi:adenosine deaminase